MESFLKNFKIAMTGIFCIPHRGKHASITQGITQELTMNGISNLSWQCEVIANKDN